MTKKYSVVYRPNPPKFFVIQGCDYYSFEIPILKTDSLGIAIKTRDNCNNILTD